MKKEFFVNPLYDIPHDTLWLNWRGHVVDFPFEFATLEQALKAIQNFQENYPTKSGQKFQVVCSLEFVVHNV